MNSFKRAILLGTAVLCAGTAAAQDTGQPAVRGRWHLSTVPEPRPVWIHWNLPSVCDDPTFASLDAWNAAGSKLQFGFVDFTGTRIAQEDNSNINIEDGPRDSVTLASTFWTVNEYTAIPTITDADIIVNTDKLFYGTDQTGAFYCGAPNTLNSTNYDYRSVIFHEFGHVGGFRHGTNASCIMFESLSKGQRKHGLCSGESTLWRDLYDTSINPY